MPRNKKEGLLFSFIMSAIMIYAMAALNYGVRTSDIGIDAWSYALLNFPLAFLVGITCDLCLCTPISRKIMEVTTKESDRPVWKGLVVKFSMVVLMTICMTMYGAFAVFGIGVNTMQSFFMMFPYNFTIALPIQMCIIAPLTGMIVHTVGNVLSWNGQSDIHPIQKPSFSLNEIILNDVYTVPESASVLDAARLLAEKRISGVPVVSLAHKTVGFISDSDILRYFAKSDVVISDVSDLIVRIHKDEDFHAKLHKLLTVNVMQVASRQVISVNDKISLSGLCNLFGLHKLKKVPVVDNWGVLIGVINRSDLTRETINSYLNSQAA